MTVNEITNISQTGWVTPAYDAAGNMISGPKAGAEGTRLHFTYDAWNRLVWVYSDDGNGQADDLIASYEYDGASRRVQKTLGEGESAVVQDVYFNSGWQVLEVRQGADPDPLDQYLWDLSYIDTPVLRFHDGNRDGDVIDITGTNPPDNTLYYMTDVNHNVTGLYDGDAGVVVERYFTDQYGGRVIVFDRVWSEVSGGVSAFGNPIGFGGYWFDQKTGNNYARNRYYNASTATWYSRDPFEDGLNLYRYVGSRPTNATDPTGLAETFGEKFYREVKNVIPTLATQHSKYLYYKPTGLGNLFAELQWTLKRVSFAVTGNGTSHFLPFDTMIVLGLNRDKTPHFEDVFHESIHAHDYSNGWYVHNSFYIVERAAEGLAYAADFLQDHLQNDLRRMEDPRYVHDAASARTTWNGAWKSLNSFGSQTVYYGKNKPFNLTAADLWDVNAKLKFRVSCSQLKPLYERMLWQKGIRDSSYSWLPYGLGSCVPCLLQCPANLAAPLA